LVETISNPKLRVADLSKLADLCHSHDARLLVDNTFASPIVCRPLDLGADLVVESLTKIMNGHGDTTLGLLCGRSKIWNRIPAAISSWGMTSGPFDCWLAERGASTLYLRMSAAAESAMSLAKRLGEHPKILEVAYPGLESHPDQKVATSQFLTVSDRPCFGNIITIEVAGGIDGARRFMAATEDIPYCPSLGELTTTLSHPYSSSHRNLSPEQLKLLGISGGTIRLSIGLESSEFIGSAIENALNAC